MHCAVHCGHDFLANPPLMKAHAKPALAGADFARLFLRGLPLLDVRAPCEFASGAIPGAVNLPLLDDDQRQQIGLEYKRHGQAAAIKLGMDMARPAVKVQRLEQWQQFVRNYPDGYLYCSRGGLRSQTTQHWLAEAGVVYPVVTGGYKALRSFLLQQLQQLAARDKVLLLGGATGVGKTALIAATPNALNLEGRANHRGSAFGKMFQPQPAQADWENQIIIDWMRCTARTVGPVLIEAESHLIGRIHLPLDLRVAMARAPIVLLEASIEQRVERLYQEYVVNSLAHYRTANVDPYQALKKSTLENLSKIKKRLGGLRFQQLSRLLEDALTRLKIANDPQGFRALIQSLLTEYYDPLYQYHQQHNASRIVMRGRMPAVRAWLTRNS